MSQEDTANGSERTGPSPSEAFALLSSDTRLAALEVLWEANEPLRFTELADRAGITDTGNLNYHLGKLDGWFLRRENERYGLTYAGRQAVLAVLTGDITGQPTLDPVRLDLHCPYCQAEVILVHYGDILRVVCTACEGTYRTKRPDLPRDGLPENGTITALMFPTAGIRNRDPESLLEAGLARTASRWRDVTDGFCPDCGGTTESTVSVCSDHDSGGICENCDSRFAGARSVTCDICGQRYTGQLALNSVVDPTAVTFFADHGVNVLDPTWETARRLLQCEERIHSIDPVEVEVVWTEGSQSLRMRVGTDGEVLEMCHDGRQ